MAKQSKKLVVLLGATSSICLLLVFFRWNIAPLGSWKQQLSYRHVGLMNSTSINKSLEEEGNDHLNFLVSRLVRGPDRTKLGTTGLSCHSDLHSDICVTDKNVRIDTRAFIVYLSPDHLTQPTVQRVVRPYARKDDATAMKAVTQVKILHDTNTNTQSPACDVTHDVPAVIFSSGGFTGNLFHEFNEIIIPLFITCRHFRSRLRFIITDYKPWWITKYRRILTHLSDFDVIDSGGDDRVHCFPGAVIGLKYHDNLSLNTSEIPGGYSMFDFKRFLRESFDLKIKNATREIGKKPLLILISRRNSRKFLNEDEMLKMVNELGFRVLVAPPNQMANLDEFSGVVNSCSVLVGAHGAGLTNMVFLPAGAVVVQVVPLGLDWPSAVYYGDRPSRDIGLHYLEYRIEPEESSLFNKYGRDHPVITDPTSIHMQGYRVSRAVYLDGQNLKLNLVKFRETLLRALQVVGSKKI